MEIYIGKGIEGSFVASNGWLRRYLARSGLANRRVTGQAQKIPDNAGVMCHAFIDLVHTTIKEKSKYWRVKISTCYKILHIQNTALTLTFDMLQAMYDIQNTFTVHGLSPTYQNIVFIAFIAVLVS